MLTKSMLIVSKLFAIILKNQYKGKNKYKLQTCFFEKILALYKFPDAKKKLIN